MLTYHGGGFYKNNTENITELGACSSAPLFQRHVSLVWWSCSLSLASLATARGWAAPRWEWSQPTSIMANSSVSWTSCLPCTGTLIFWLLSICQNQLFIFRPPFLNAPPHVTMGSLGTFPPARVIPLRFPSADLVLIPHNHFIVAPASWSLIMHYRCLSK